jgi:tetratricopeptide (TPR) repeat protein
LAWLNKGRTTPDNLAQARGFFDRALAADPNNIDAIVRSAYTDVLAGNYSFVADSMTVYAAAEAKLTKALSSVPDHPIGHMWLGFLHILTKRAAEGIAECEYALALDRNLALAHAYIGLGKTYIGRPHVGEAMRISPRDTTAYIWMLIVGVAKLYLGSCEQAVAWSRRAIEINRSYTSAYFVLAAALAQLGRLDEARSAVKAGLALNPAFSISRARGAWTAVSDHPRYLALIEPTLHGLRIAGVPEQ